MYDDFLAALRAGDPAECEPLIRKMRSAGRLSIFYTVEETFLHTMAREGHVAACSILLDAGVDVDDAWKGKTPLHLASQHGHLEVCRVLIQHGADVNRAYWPNLPAGIPSELVTPLSNAAFGGHQHVCRLLVDSGASGSFMPKTANMKALTAFQSMVAYGHVAMVRWFVLETGEDLAQRTKAGRTLMQIANGTSSPQRAAAMKATLRSLKTELAVAGAIAAPADVGAAKSKRTDVMIPL